MAASQSVSIRVPQDLLEQLDAIATQNYPVRKNGTPNRSRMILDVIQRGVKMSDNSQTASPERSQTVLDNNPTMSNNDIKELITQQVAQQVQIQLQIQQQVRQQLEQTYSSSVSEIAELRQEVAEVKSVLEAQQSRPDTIQSSTPDKEQMPIADVVPKEQATSGSMKKLMTSLIAVRKIKSQVPRDRFSTEDIERAAQLSLAANGLVNPIIVRRTSLQTYEVVDRYFEYYVAVRAREIDPRKGEMIGAFVLEPNNSDAILSQVKALRFHEGEPAKEVGQPISMEELDVIAQPLKGLHHLPETLEQVDSEERSPALHSDGMTAKQVKTSSELKQFGLELSQDQEKQRQQPCDRALKARVNPSDEEILQMIRDLDQQLRTDNYLPIFHLREKLQPPLSRDELDQALYRLERKDLIELSALQEVIAYTPEQIDAGIPQNIGGRLFFIMVE